MSNNHFKKDPRYNLFYYWGLLSFTAGLILLTLIPAMAHIKFSYPPELLFTLPGSIFIISSLFIWRYATNTELYQGVIIGCGIIFYSCFQILIQLNFTNTHNLIIHSITLLTGILIFLSAYDIKANNVRKSFNYSLLVLTSCLCFILMTAVVVKHVLYS